MKVAHDPWAEQDALDKAVEKGGTYTCPKTGWKIRVRYFAPWSAHPRKAATLVMARESVAELAKRKSAGEKLTKEEEAAHDRAMLEIGIRSTVINWQGVKGRDGKTLEFTMHNCLVVFGHFKGLWESICEFAVNPANFEIGVPAPVTDVPDGVDAEGNSPATSDTSSGDSADS